MFEQAKWIWNRDANGQDCYVNFLTKFEYQKNKDIVLRISADTDYAVYVNGIFVDSGQYADYPHFKVYDEIGLTKVVREGNNHIAVIVWYEGFQGFTHYVGSPGLLFEIEQEGRVITYSDTHIVSRKSRFHVSGRNEMITPQLGLNFHLDFTQRDLWMCGENMDSFTNSVIVNDMPQVLFQRECKKLIVEPRLDTKIVCQGNFEYLNKDTHNGDKMQHAALTHFRLEEMCEDKTMTLMQCRHGEGIYFIIDLCSEQVGFLDFELEVSKECQMEVGWGEHLEDGRCRTQIFVRNFSIDVKLKKGRNAYMHPLRRLGCRYVQFFVHAPEVKVHYAGLRPTVYPVKKQEYHDESLLREQIYQVCQNTLIQCMHEHYEDCPWREQTFYTLDSRNQMLCGYFAFEEYQFPRAGLKLIAKGIRSDGTLPIGFPSSSRLCIPSFTLFYIIQVAEYYMYSKDAETVKEVFPSVKRIIQAFGDRIDESGLIPNFDEEKEFWNFYEWQPYLDGHTYHESCHDMCLNALFSWTLDYFMQLCQVVGEEIQPYKVLKQKMNHQIFNTFFAEHTGLFRLCDIPKIDQYSVLANAWGYLCGAAEQTDSSEIIKLLIKNGTEKQQELSVIPTTLSMHTFRYEALLKKDKDAYKETILRELDQIYLKMLMQGATSFWETEKGASDFSYAGSLCHGWSAMPIYYYKTLKERKE